MPHLQVRKHLSSVQHERASNKPQESRGTNVAFAPNSMEARADVAIFAETTTVEAAGFSLCCIALRYFCVRTGGRWRWRMVFNGSRIPSEIGIVRRRHCAL